LPGADAMREEIVELIDKHWNSWVKAAFYSDPQVSRIMDRLVAVWQENGEEGRPIDYASEDELVILLRAARRYYLLDPKRAMAVALANMGREDEDNNVRRGRSLFRRLFSRGQREASP